MRCRPRICALAFAIVVAASAPAFADPNMLKVESLAVSPPYPFSGNQVTITATFKSLAYETIAYDVDWVIQVGATTVRSGVRPQLAAGVSFTETATWTAVGAGPHTVRASVGYDPQEVDPEYRNDNARTSVLNVQRGIGEIVEPEKKRLAPTEPVGRIPYRMELQVSPGSGATPQTPVVLSLKEGGATPGVRQCAFEASPTNGGAFWSANGGSSCRVTTQLAAGTYRLRASVATADSPSDAPTSTMSLINNYVVTAPGTGTTGGGTGGSPPAPLANPVIVLGSVNYVAANFNIDYTVCNVDTNATYTPTLSPSGPPPGYAGNPPEDFVPQAFSNNGAGMSPSCPGGLTHSAGVKPALNLVPPNGIIGGRPACGGSLTYRLKVEAVRGSERKTAEATFSVTPASPWPCPN